MRQIILALAALLLTPNVFAFLTCDEALKAIEPYEHSGKSCELVHGMPTIKYHKTKGIPGPVNCDTIPGILTSQGRSVQDCLTVNGSSFFRIDQLYDWQGAWVACHGVPGGNLASVRNIQEFVAVRQLVEAGHVISYGLFGWIGLNDLDQEGVYRWSDDSSVSTYRRFIVNQPSGGSERNCVYSVLYADSYSTGHYVPNVGWRDGGCEEKYVAICSVTPV